jgi:hypothetical protein
VAGVRDTQRALDAQKVDGEKAGHLPIIGDARIRSYSINMRNLLSPDERLSRER